MGGCVWVGEGLEESQMYISLGNFQTKSTHTQKEREKEADYFQVTRQKRRHFQA